MSEAVTAALISGALVLVGAILTTVANLVFNYRLEEARLRAGQEERGAEREEWYRRHLFESRLEAVRRAHRWLMDIRRALAAPGSNDPQSEAAAELRRIAREARDWYDDNALFFEDGLPTVSSFVGITNQAMAYGATRDRELVLNPYPVLDEADREVRERARALMENVAESTESKPSEDAETQPA